MRVDVIIIPHTRNVLIAKPPKVFFLKSDLTWITKFLFFSRDCNEIYFMFFPCVSIYSRWDIIRDSTVCRDCDGEKNPNEVACWNEKEEEGMSLCVGFMTAAGLRQSGFSLLCAVVCVLSGGHPVSVRMRAPRKTKIGRGKWKKLPPRAYYPVSPLPPSSV